MRYFHKLQKFFRKECKKEGIGIDGIGIGTGNRWNRIGIGKYKWNRNRIRIGKSGIGKTLINTAVKKFNRLVHLINIDKH